MDHVVVKRILSCMAALFLCACAIPSAEGEPPAPRVVVPGVGQGGGVALIQGARAIAFDAGPDSSAVLSRCLAAESVDRFELLVVTHWDLDHVGGLDTLISRGQVGRIVHGAEPVDAWMRGRKASWCARVPGGCTLVADGSRIDALEGLAIEFVRASPDAPTENDRSLVVRVVRHGGEGLLLATGDLDTTGEAGIVASGAPLRARVLLVGHHGSRGSSSLPFLGAVRPEIAFVQAGASNTYGHPHVEAMERLRETVPDVRVIRDGMTDSVTP